MLPSNALTFVVLALAAYRLTRVVTKDSLTVPIRERIYRWAWDDTKPIAEGDALVPTSRGPIRSYAYELLTCSWCLGVWVSAGVYSAWRWGDADWIDAIIVIAAIAGAQGFLASREGT